MQKAGAHAPAFLVATTAAAYRSRLQSADYADCGMTLINSSSSGSSAGSSFSA
jgi:hypothetical protein